MIRQDGKERYRTMRGYKRKDSMRNVSSLIGSVRMKGGEYTGRLLACRWTGLCLVPQSLPLLPRNSRPSLLGVPLVPGTGPPMRSPMDLPASGALIAFAHDDTPFPVLTP